MTWLDTRVAPGRLEVVRGFVNTLDRARGPELLARPAAARDWLVAQSLADDLRLGDAGLERTIELREALRALLLASGGGPTAPAAAATVNEVAVRAGLAPLLQDDGTARLVVAAGGLDGALGAIVALVFDAVGAGTWPRLRACASCQWAFYDTSRNRSSRWCDMSICGNRAKQRALRRRRHPQP